MKSFTASVVVLSVIPLIAAQAGTMPSAALAQLVGSSPTCLALSLKLAGDQNLLAACQTNNPTNETALAICACPFAASGLTASNCIIALALNSTTDVMVEAAGLGAQALSAAQACVAFGLLPASVLSSNGTTSANSTTPASPSSAVAPIASSTAIAASASSAAASVKVSSAAVASSAVVSATSAAAPVATTKAASATKIAGIGGLVLGGLVLLL